MCKRGQDLVAQLRAILDAHDPGAGKRRHTPQTGVKRPLSAYMEYMRIIRPEIGKENPDIANKDIVKLIGEKWRALDKDGRKPYTDKAAANRVAYDLKVAKALNSAAVDSGSDSDKSAPAVEAQAAESPTSPPAADALPDSDSDDDSLSD